MSTATRSTVAASVNPVIARILGLCTAFALISCANDDDTSATLVDPTANAGGSSPCTAPASQRGKPTEAVLLHRTGLVDAFNLSLEIDGTVRASLTGCDFGRQFDAAWRREKDGIVILPVDDQPLPWITMTLMTVLEVRFPSDLEDPIVARLITPEGVIEEDWATGRLCACCGSLGPSYLAACDGPLAENRGSTLDCNHPCAR